MESVLRLFPHGRRLLAAWFLLALTALAFSTLCAVLLVVARAPLPGIGAASGDLFGRALVLHVSLAIVVWFLACAAAFWTLAADPAASRAAALRRRALFALAAAGLAAMLLALFASSATPVLANYIPVLDHPLFLTGLVLFAAGVALQGAECLRSAMRAAASGPVWRLGACLSMVAAVFSLGALLASLALGGTPTTAQGFEVLAWGPGHVLQFVHVLLLMSVWTVLAERALGQELAPRCRLVALFALAAVPLLAVPLIYLLHPVDSVAFRRAFTLLMAWGSWPAPAMLAGLTALRVLRSARNARAACAAEPALLLSILLFLIGCVLGALIRNDSTMVPAHYHGTVGAVTLAYMALGYRLLPAFGLVLSDARLVRWQPVIYGLGLVVLALALAWSGWLGVPRKTLHANVIVQYPAYFAAMGLAGIGGLLAVAGAAMFVMNVLRALTAIVPRLPLMVLSERPVLLVRRTVRPARRDVRVPAMVLTVALTLATGLLIRYWPAGVNAMAIRDDEQAQLTRHALRMREQEVQRRFAAAAELLAAREYDAAATELDRLLTLVPQMPEVHVNMGFALVGLEQYALARDFFSAAIDLRTTQMNAYYGLGIALEALGDLPGALGAMRTYVHRGVDADPFLRKANAAIREWEERLAEARMTGKDEQVAAATIPELGKSTIRYPITEKRFD